MARRVVLSVSGTGLKLAGRQRAATAPPEQPRVLLIRPDHVGDVVLTSPSVEVLRKGLPQAHLTMMVGQWSEDVARRDTLLDEVIVCPFPGFTRSTKASPLDPYRLLWRMASALRRGRYDAALVLRFDHWWGAWMASLAGIPIRAGHDVPDCRPFLTLVVEPLPRESWVGRSLRVAGSLLTAWGQPYDAMAGPPLRFRTLEEDEVEASRLWHEAALDDAQSVVVLHPGSGAPLKLWPEARWVELGHALASDGLRIVVTGSSGEAELAGWIAREIPRACSLAGKTGIGGLASLYRRCDLVAGVDSGPLHIAVALGIPSVRLFGPTDPAVYGPWGDPRLHRVVTAGLPDSPCNRLDLQPRDRESPACMRAITVEQVLTECRELLRNRCLQKLPSPLGEGVSVALPEGEAVGLPDEPRGEG